VRTLAPFAGWLVRQDRAEQVASPMHDALSLEDRVATLRSNPFSFLQVTASPQERAMAGSLAEPDPATALAHLVGSDAYRPLPPGLVVYRVTEGGRAHTGVVADVATAAFGDGRVLGHEAVNPARVEALAAYADAVPARSELVALLHRRDAALDATVAAVTATQPAVAFGDPALRREQVWAVDDPAVVDTLVQRLGAGPLYVADGHHRVAAAMRREQETGAHPRVLCAVFAEDGLDLVAFSRRVTGPLDATTLLAGLAQVCQVRPLDGPHPARRGVLQVYLAGAWWELEPRAPRRAGSAGLDVSVLHTELLGPLLGIWSVEDPRLVVVPQRAADHQVVASVDADGGALFRLAAPDVTDLADLAERGEVMPAKATYFAPKTSAGVVLVLDGA